MTHIYCLAMPIYLMKPSNTNEDTETYFGPYDGAILRK